MMPDPRRWLDEYLERYRTLLSSDGCLPQLVALRDMLLEVRNRKAKVMIAGNGASAAIASHCATDLTKNARVRAVTFNEASFITCLANDLGYENWVAEAIAYHGDRGDAAILISSSGKSPNMLRAAEACGAMGVEVITLSGFDPQNPLRKLGKLNLWVDSRAYNIVENMHQIWLTAVADLVIGKAEYSVDRPASAR